MARRTIYRSNSLNLSNPPDGYFYVGYEGVTFSQLDDEGNITPIGGTGAGGVGSSGTSGTSGFDGTSGTSGTTGTSGFDGSSGTTGTSGTSGTSGFDGSSGTTGTSGSSGTTGTSGSSGTTGASGSSGTTGTSGTSGSSGLLSLTGNTNNGLITLDSNAPNATVEQNLTFDGTTLNVTGNLFVFGSFSVSGSASSINTNSLVVSDTIIALGHSQSGTPVLDEGLMFVRGTGATQAFIWDESEDTFALISTNDDHTVIGNVDINSYSNLRVGGLTTSSIKISNGAVNGYFLQSDSSGNATWAFIPGGLTGSGTTNYITKWTGSNNLSTTSSIYDDGSKVGILTTSPGATLDVRGSAVFNADAGDFDFLIKGDTDTNLFSIDASNDSINIGVGSYLTTKVRIVSTTSSQVRALAVENSLYDGDYAYSIIGDSQSPNAQYNIGIQGAAANSTTENWGVRGIAAGTTKNNKSLLGEAVTPNSATNYAAYLDSINDGSGTAYALYTYRGGSLFNGFGGDYDFKIRGITDSNLFFVDASTDSIGVGNSSPSYKLHVSGTVSTTGIRITNGAVNGYILKSDSDGVASWAIPSSLALPSKHIQNGLSLTAHITSTITHNLATQSITCQAWDTSSGESVNVVFKNRQTNSVDILSTTNVIVDVIIIG